MILFLWNQKGCFPVIFEETECLKDHDESAYYIRNSLETLTSLVGVIFKELETLENENCSPRVMQKYLTEFLC